MCIWLRPYAISIDQREIHDTINIHTYIHTYIHVYKRGTSGTCQDESSDGRCHWNYMCGKTQREFVSVYVTDDI
jgi:hypothetical protein